jgi:hypothetical protein
MLKAAKGEGGKELTTNHNTQRQAQARRRQQRPYSATFSSKSAMEIIRSENYHVRPMKNAQ